LSTRLNITNLLQSDMSLNAWYWFGCIAALLYGIKHLSDPNDIARSWGLTQFSDVTQDFARLLGVWILFQSGVAAITASHIKDLQSRYYMTVMHVFKNFVAFLVRCHMWRSERYPITNGFMLSTFADLLFSVGYGYYVVFPEREKKPESQKK
jgi:hypothetical protein